MPPEPAGREEVLRAALRQSRWSLALASLLLVGFVAVLAWLFCAFEQGLLVREDRILSEAKEHLAEHADEIFAEAGDLAAETLPPVADAFAEQAEEDLALYLRAISEQGEVLAENLADSLRRKARSQYREYLAKHRAVLRKELPKLSDGDALKRLEAAFERALDRLLDRYFVDEFRAVSKRLAKSWRAIPPAPPRRPGEPPRYEELLGAVATWAELEFTGPAAPADKVRRGGEGQEEGRAVAVATEATVQDLERGVRFNARLTTALLALFVALLAGVGGYAWWRAGRLLRPENLVETAERRIEKGYPEIRAELKKAVVKNAPALADKLSRRGLKTVPQARARLERFAERKMEAGLEKATALSAERFRALLRDNRDLILQAYQELLEAPGEARQAVVRLEKEVEKWAGTDIQKDARLVLGFLYLLVEKLERLGRDEKELTPQERAERRVVRLLRAMQER